MRRISVRPLLHAVVLDMDTHIYITLVYYRTHILLILLIGYPTYAFLKIR